MRVLRRDGVQIILGDVQDARDWVIRVEVSSRGNVITDLFDDGLA
jgi:hypothetical protein